MAAHGTRDERDAVAAAAEGPGDGHPEPGARTEDEQDGEELVEVILNLVPEVEYVLKIGMLGVMSPRADAVRNRQKLVDAARESFSEHGVDVSLERIAKRAGVSIGTLYNHFADRGELVDAVLPDRLAYLDALAAAADAEPDPWTAFEGFLDALIAAQASDRTVNEAVAREPSARSTSSPSAGAPAAPSSPSSTARTPPGSFARTSASTTSRRSWSRWRT
ncbi:hypothetical protein MTP03_24570 [Tsukamurella sp. PLM1]|nr:TetR/AcrR family transcriptional regulator [Tsukamurella sp. PLM1]BDH57518.1 hypothetical protein MTP03_24570 [Tsukamurella sp. PLM1]